MSLHLLYSFILYVVVFFLPSYFCLYAMCHHKMKFIQKICHHFNFIEVFCFFFLLIFLEVFFVVLFLLNGTNLTQEEKTRNFFVFQKKNTKSFFFSFHFLSLSLLNSYFFFIFSFFLSFRISLCYIK